MKSGDERLSSATDEKNTGGRVSRTNHLEQ